MSRLTALVLALLVAGSVLAASALGGPDQRRVQLKDDCDPATFNAPPPVGPGLGTICVGTGTTTFADFIATLTAKKQVPAWKFTPASGGLRLDAGGTIEAVNTGGEDHSFTEVGAFGGGCVDILNILSGNLVKVPECADPAKFPGTIIPSGGEATIGPLAPGVHLFECLIHPWMRTTVTVGQG